MDSLRTMSGGQSFEQALVVRPVVAPQGTLRVWVGTPNRHPQVPTIRVDTKDASSHIRWIRPFERTAAVNGRTYSGVVEIDCLDSTRPHDIEVTVQTDDETLSASLTTRGIPSRVPVPGSVGDDGEVVADGAAFRVLLVSCYAAEHDLGAGKVVRRLAQRLGVDMVLAVGDQVYLDQPWGKAEGHAIDDALLGGPTRLLEDKYWANWGATRHDGPIRNGFTEILQAAPVASIPDDHEYWNNYPHRSPIASTFVSGNNEIRDQWGAIARGLFDSFQLAHADEYDYPIDVAPLSFWMMDNRTFRTRNRKTSMRVDGPKPGLQQFQGWVQRVIDQRLLPVLITGPSLIQPAASGIWGHLKHMFGDYNLADYEDYRRIVEGIMLMSQAGLPVVLLTGDVHYGRVLRITPSTGGPSSRVPGDVFEVISSPVALVSSLAKGWAPMKTGRFTFDGTRYHSITETRLFPTSTQPGYSDLPRLDQAGDHVAVLSFTHTTGGVDLRIEYHMIPEQLGVHQIKEPISLRLPTGG